MTDQMTCQCGDVYDGLAALLNHCRLMHPGLDLTPVDPVTADTTSTGGRVSTHWASAGMPIKDRIDEALADIARGLDLPPGLYLAWDDEPLVPPVE